MMLYTLSLSLSVSSPGIEVEHTSINLCKSYNTSIVQLRIAARVANYL